MEKSNQQKRKEASYPDLYGAQTPSMKSLEKVLILLRAGQNKPQNKSSNYLHHLLAFRFFSPLFGIHICRSRARLPGAHHVKHTTLAWSLKWGSTRLPPVFLTNSMLAKTVWCKLHAVGIRQWEEAGEAQTQRKRISILSFLTKLKGSSSFADRQVYLCWKETQKQ